MQMKSMSTSFMVTDFQENQQKDKKGVNLEVDKGIKG